MTDRTTRTLLAALALGVGAASLAHAGDGVRCSWDQVELVERRTHPIHDARFARDYLDLTLHTGTLHVLTACGRDVGLVFSGDAEVTVRDPGPLRGHRLHNTFVELPGIAVVDRFVLWGSDGAVEELLAQAQASNGDAVPTAVRALLQTRQGPFRVRSDHFNPPPGSTLFAPTTELGGLLVDFHALSLKRKRRGENLEIRSQWISYGWNPLAYAGSGAAGRWYQRRVGSTESVVYSAFPSEAAVDQAESPFVTPVPRPAWDQTEVTAQVLVDDVRGMDNDLSGVAFDVTTTLEATDGTDAARRVVPLRLQQGLTRWVGEPWAPIRVLGVRLADDDDGPGLVFDRAGDALFVHLPEAIRPGAEVRLRIQYRGDLLQPTSTTTIAPVSGRGWLPTLPGVDRFRSVISIRAPKRWEVAATGARIETLTLGRMRTTTYRQTRPCRTAAFVLFEGPQRTTPAPGPGLPALRLHRAQGILPSSGAFEDEIHGHLRVLSDLLGPFPYPELEIVETGTAGGTVHPGLVLVSRFDAPPNRTITTMVGSTTLLGALARQWVVHDLGPTTDRDLWLIEGLSVLAQCRALEQAGQAARCRGLLQARRDRWVDSLQNLGWTTAQSVRDSIVGSVWLGPLSGHPESAWARGPLVIDAMRLLVGSKVTLESLRRVAASYRGQSLSTQSFVLQAQAAAGRDLRSFFAWWVFATPQHPRLQLQWETGRQDDGKWTLVGTLTLSTGRDDDPLLGLVPTVARITLESGDRLIQRLVARSGEVPIEIRDLDARVTGVVLDPGRVFPGKATANALSK